MTINDIAKLAKVSTATVSRVINGKGNVSVKMRKRVKAAMETAGGYIPNMFARGMTQGTIKSIGVLCPALIDPILTTYISILEGSLREASYSTLIISNTGRSTDKTPFLSMLLSKMVDAIIIIGSSMQEYESEDSFSIASSRVPVMVVNGCVKSPNVYNVFCNERGAITDIVTALVEKGYHRILYIYDTNTFSGYQKITGYKEGLANAGINMDQSLIRRHIADTDLKPSARVGSCTLVRNALQEKLSFDSIITADDILAAGAIEALREAGIRPGLDIPVIGFNNSAIAECTYPKLTTVDNLPNEMCSLAASQLLSILSGKVQPKNIVTSYKLIERDTFSFQKPR